MTAVPKFCTRLYARLVITIPAMLLFPLLACGQKITSISGEIKNTKEIKVFLKKDLDVTSADIASGKFSFSFPLLKEGFFEFQFNDFDMEVYVEPGDSLVLNGNDEDLEKNLVFSGSRAGENNYCLQRDLKRSNVYNPVLRAIRRYPEKEFLATLDSVIHEMQLDWNQYFKTHNNLSEKFNFYELANFDYIKANQQSIYGNNFSANHKNGEVLSAGYDGYLANLKYNNPALLPAPRYQDFVRNIRYNETDKLLSKHPEMADSASGNIKAMFRVADSLFKNPLVKSYSLYTTLKLELRQHGLSIPRSVVDEFYKKCIVKEYNNTIRENYYTWTTLAKGNAAPGFTIADSSEKMFSLKDLKGKYVYIDVWATWCGPCLKEGPSWDSLVLSNANNNIAFVKISIDLDKSAWKKMVVNLTNKEFNLRVENGANSTFAKAYAIRDIPRFMLINKDGTIMNVDAPAPSTEEFKTYLQKLLSKQN